MFYNKNEYDVFRLMKLPEGSELNLYDLIKSSNSGDPSPAKDVWIQPTQYFQLVKKEAEEEILVIKINSKIEYDPEDPSKKSVSFLSSQKEFKLVCGKVRTRKKINIDWISIFTTFLSVVAIAFSYLTYKVQKEEIDLAKNPVWLTSYSPSEMTLSFKSPASEIQLQEGYVSFNSYRKLNGQFLFMPDMKISLVQFNENFSDFYNKLPREKKSYYFGANRIYETIAVATRYTYKGEERYKGALYKIYIDAFIPKESDRNMKIKVLVRGASFLRFLSDGETLASALEHNMSKEPTESPEWTKLISN